MQRLTVLLMPLVLALLPCTGNADQIPPGASQAPLYASPPIVGIWVLKLPNACTETYNYRSDGVLSVSSGEELAESSYTLDPTPGPKGFYRLVDKVLRTNGKPDCSGELTPIGDVATIYIRIDSSGNRLVICLDEALTQCFGPAIRQSGG